LCRCFKPVSCSKRSKATHSVCCIVGISCDASKSGTRRVLIKNRRQPRMQARMRLVLQAMEVLMVIKMQLAANLQMLQMQGQMVGRRRKNDNVKVKVPSLLVKTFTWMRWRLCGLRRKRCKI
ncbi:hypothetical protein BAE44_0011002, partial [Dichanthelium oligosanthes]